VVKPFQRFPDTLFIFLVQRDGAPVAALITAVKAVAEGRGSIKTVPKGVLSYNLTTELG